MSKRSGAPAHFVHDFAGIDLPLSTVVDAIDVIAATNALADFVVAAWCDEVRVLEAAEQAAPHRLEPCLTFAYGIQRVRSDAVIVPIAWHTVSGPWVPPLEADLELAAFGPDRTHIHVYGSSQLPQGAVPSSQAASLAQRLTVAVVRHVLNLVIERIVELAAIQAQADSLPGTGLRPER